VRIVFKRACARRVTVSYESPCPLPFYLHSNNPRPFLNNMKPTVAEDEFEDAEEENKFINEVCVKDEVLH
jgi:hypothetical protein